MIITKKHLSRRTFLRGAFGAAVALPLLDSMIPAVTAQARTAAARSLRFGAVYVPNGVLPDRWHPTSVGRDFAFSAVMQPLTPFREQLITVSGLMASGTPGPHLGASCGWLNGLGAVGRQGAPIVSGKSLDQFIVDKVGGDTPLPSIEVGTEDMGTAIGACDGYACTYFNAMAWRTETAPLPVEINPRIIFERMFGETGTSAERIARLNYRRSILDSLTEEVASLRQTLPARDQRTLADYLDNVREVERRIQQVIARSQQSLEAPALPSGVPESFEEHMTLTYDLMHLAFQGDISRVFTFLTGVEASNRGYSFIGIPESHHVCSHHGSNPTMMDKYTTIVTWQLLQFAKFVQKLKDTPDGDGSLLDHTLLYWGSGMSNGNQHDRFTPPAVLVGGANGRMQGIGGQHIAANREPSANLLVAIADLADVQVEKIGPSNGRLAL